MLRDGGTAHIRPIGPDDAEPAGQLLRAGLGRVEVLPLLRALPAAVRPRTSTASRTTTTSTGWAWRPPSAASSSPPSATTASTPDGMRRVRARPTRPRSPSSCRTPTRGAGVASALLEHIAAVARERGILHFTAEVLPANRKMIKVFTDAGYTQQRSFEDGVVHLDLDLEPTERVPRGHAGPRAPRRGALGAAAAARPAPSPSSAPGARPGGVGRTRAAQHPGRRLHRPRCTPSTRPSPRPGADLDGVPGHRSVADDRREPVDLAVVAVPAERVPEAVADCGEHGVQGLVVVVRRLLRERARRAGAPARTRAAGPRVRHAGHRAQRLRRHQHRRRRSGSTPRCRPRCRAAAGIGLFTQSGRDRHRAAVRPAPARRRTVHLRLGRQPRRRLRQRPAPVLAGRPGHRRRADVPRILRQPAQVHPPRPAHRGRQARGRRQGRAAQRRGAAGPRRAGRPASRDARSPRCCGRPG